MNVRYIVACLAVWIFFSVFDGIFHGCAMAPFYEQTSEVWRPKKEMDGLCVWMSLSTIIGAFLFGLIFTKGYERLGIAEGARYGWLIGLLFAAGAIMWWVVLPIPPMLAAAWAVGDLIRFTLGGIILAAIYRPSRA